MLLTDISYLKYGEKHRAYLSTIMDAQTNEILSFEISENMKIDFVLKTLHNLERHSFVNWSEGTMHHKSPSLGE